MAKRKMIQLNNIWKDRGIPTALKVQVLKCLIWPVILYGCEAWTCRKADEKKIEATEIWLYRRLPRVRWTDRRTNESILKELGVTRQLLGEVNKRKLTYLGQSNQNNTQPKNITYEDRVSRES